MAESQRGEEGTAALRERTEDTALRGALRLLRPGAGRDAYAANRALVQITGTDSAVAPKIIGYTRPDYRPDAAPVSQHSLPSLPAAMPRHL